MKGIIFEILGAPRTKKNSQRIVVAGSRPRIVPSAAAEEYEHSALWQLPRMAKPLDTPVNVKCVYYMPTARRVDLVNLLEATCDILVRGHVLADDNCRIVAGHDGSRVLVDRERPRVEITITEMMP